MSIPKSCLCVSTPTSGTGSLWRILSTIGRDVYKPVKISETFERNGRGNDLAGWSPDPYGSLYLYNTPHIVNSSILDPNTKVIVNFRDPRDLACNQYHWVFQHPTNKSGQELEDYYNQIREAGIDSFVLNSENGILFRSIKALLPRIKLQDPNVLVLSYNQLCLDFDKMLLRIAAFLGVDPATMAKDVLELERVEKLKGNPSWIGQIWTGTDIMPGRYKRELRPETVRAVDDKYAVDLKMLRSIEQPQFRHLLTTYVEEEEMSRVLVGKGNNLFLTKDANDTVGQITGKKKMPSADIYNTAFSHYSRRVFGKTIASFSYAHAIIPSKEVAKKALLPETVTFEGEGPRPVSQFLSEASSIWRPFYQPKLLEDVGTTQKLYYPLTDSHWNHVGALRYLRAFLQEVDPTFALALDNIEMRQFQAKQQGDLGLKLELPPEEIEIIAPKQTHARLVFENRISNEGSIRWFVNPKKTGKRAFILHDSFAMWLFGYLAELFEEVIFFHGTVFDFNFITQFNPTTVLCFQAERFLPRVPETGSSMMDFIKVQEIQKKAEGTFASAWEKRGASE